MVKVALHYNPYLQETTVEFNGRLPKINSPVEKHLRSSAPLHSWMHEIPAIFRNEMNGFGFELLFQGIAEDFASLQAVFKGYDVELIHQNELEDAWTKNEEVAALLRWLEEHPNRRFSNADFREENAAALEKSFPYIIVQGAAREKPFPGTEMEGVDSVDELRDTDLTDTPILFCVNGGNYAAFERSLRGFLERKDVAQEQLFFLFEDYPDRFRTERFLLDAGIAKPQVVQTHDDDTIKRYLMLYPVTDYIQKAILVFREAESELQTRLAADNEQSRITNRAVNEKLDDCNARLRQMQDAVKDIKERDKYRISEGFDAVKSDCLHTIQQWQKKKTKFIADDQASASDAAAYAADLQKTSEGALETFKNALQECFVREGESVYHRLYNVYSEAYRSAEAAAPPVSYVSLDAFAAPAFERDLMTLFTEEWVDPLFSFLQKSSKPKEKIRRMTYFCETWRAYVTKKLEPILIAAIQLCQQLMEQRERELAEGFIKKLQEHTAIAAQERRVLTGQLSADAAKLQVDNEWFAAFQTKLREIEEN
jgi:hypothetical protein